MARKKSRTSGHLCTNWPSNQTLLFALYPNAACKSATKGNPPTRPARKMEGQAIGEDHEIPEKNRHFALLAKGGNLFIWHALFSSPATLNDFVQTNPESRGSGCDPPKRIYCLFCIPGPSAEVQRKGNPSPGPHTKWKEKS